MSRCSIIVIASSALPVRAWISANAAEASFFASPGVRDLAEKARLTKPYLENLLAAQTFVSPRASSVHRLRFGAIEDLLEARVRS